MDKPIKHELEKASTTKTSSQKSRQEPKPKPNPSCGRGMNLVDALIEKMIREKKVVIQDRTKMSEMMSETKHRDGGSKSSENAISNNELYPELVEAMRECQVLRKQIEIYEEQIKSFELQLESEKSDRQIVFDRLNTVEESFDVLKGYEDYVSQTLMGFQQDATYLKEVYDKIIDPQQNKIEELEREIAQINIKDQRLLLLESEEHIQVQVQRIKELENLNNEMENRLERINVESEENSNLLKETRKEKDESLLKIKMLEVLNEGSANEIQAHIKRINELENLKNEMEDRLEKIKVQSVECSNLLKETNRERDELSFTVQKLTLSNEKLLDKIKELENEIKMLEEKHDKDTETIMVLEANVTKKRGDIFAMEKALQESSTTKTNLLKERDELTTNINQLKQRTTQYESDILNLKENVQQLVLEHENYSSKTQKDGTLIEQLKLTHREIVEKYEKLKQSKHDGDVKIMDLNKAISDLKSRNGKIQNELESHRTRFAELDEKYEKLLEEKNSMTQSKATEIVQLKETLAKQDAKNLKLVNDMSLLKIENQSLLEKNCSIEKHEQDLVNRIEQDMLLLKSENQSLLEKNYNLEKYQQNIINQLKQDISLLKTQNELLTQENCNLVKSEEHLLNKMKWDISSMKIENQSLKKKNCDLEKNHAELLHKLKLENIEREKTKDTCNQLEEQLKSIQQNIELTSFPEKRHDPIVQSQEKLKNTQTKKFQSIHEESKITFDETHKKVYARRGRDKKSVSFETPLENPVKRVPCYMKTSPSTSDLIQTSKPKNISCDFLPDEKRLTPDQTFDMVMPSMEHDSPSTSQKSYSHEHFSNKGEEVEKSSVTNRKSPGSERMENKFFKSKKPPQTYSRKK